MKKAFILLAAALFLSGCGLTKEDLGMAASKPDETQVTRRNQLVIPPDFDVAAAVARSGAGVPGGNRAGAAVGTAHRGNAVTERRPGQCSGRGR